MNDNVAMQVDFRSVYTSILQDWFQVPLATLAQLFGQSFPYVPVIKQEVLATATGANPVVGFSLYPNPAAGAATVLFESQGEAVQLLLLDSLGREVRRVVDGRVLGRGPQRVPVDATGLAPGTYHCVVREGGRSSALLLLVAN
ncbi:MAG: T9SS type A sorting domain-containing protein [Hymenobacter sp.]